MRIAIIAWGSPVWEPGLLELDGGWSPDGPELPLELSRLSGGNRLTLALTPGSKPVPAFWAVSAHDDLEKAAKNLREREKTFPEHIHYVVTDGEPHKNCDPAAKAAIEGWLAEREELGAAVWNGLQSNWEARRGRAFEVSDAVQYLRDLERKGLEANAREYIRNVPAPCRTETWTVIVGKLGWASD